MIIQKSEVILSDCNLQVRDGLWRSPQFLQKGSEAWKVKYNKNFIFIRMIINWNDCIAEA